MGTNVSYWHDSFIFRVDWGCRQCAPWKCCYPFTRLHGVIMKKTAVYSILWISQLLEGAECGQRIWVMTWGSPLWRREPSVGRESGWWREAVLNCEATDKGKPLKHVPEQLWTQIILMRFQIRASECPLSFQPLSVRNLTSPNLTVSDLYSLFICHHFPKEEW
jgi:hypothetical protein